MLATLRRATGTVFHSTRVKLGVPAITVFGVVGYMSDGFQYWSWITTNWRWVLDWVHHPLFYWGLALALLAIIASGIKSSLKLQAAEASQLAAAERAETSARKDALEVPVLVAHAVVRNTELANLDLRIDQFERRVSAYESEIKPYLDGPEFPYDHRHTNMPDPTRFADDPFDRFYTFTIPPWHKKWIYKEPNLRAAGQAGMFNRTVYMYDPAANDQVKDAMRANLAMMRVRVDQLREFSAEQHRLMEKSRTELERRLAGYGK